MSEPFPKRAPLRRSEPLAEESTTRTERAIPEEGTTRRERAIRLESTIEIERATPKESTIYGERAKHSESTSDDERSIAPDAMTFFAADPFAPTFCACVLCYCSGTVNQAGETCGACRRGEHVDWLTGERKRKREAP